MSVPQPAAVSLAGLLTRVARGDQAAFAGLYQQTAARVHGLVTFMLGDGAAAEDVTAAVYRQLWHTAADYDPARGSAYAWLMGVTHRHATGHLRARRDPAAPPPAAATQLAPLTALSLPAWLEHLGPPSRELILLVYYRGYTAGQAASLLGLPAGAAGPRLRAALHPAPPPAPYRRLHSDRMLAGQGSRDCKKVRQTP